MINSIKLLGKNIKYHIGPVLLMLFCLAVSMFAVSNTQAKTLSKHHQSIKYKKPQKQVVEALAPITQELTLEQQAYALWIMSSNDKLNENTAKHITLLVYKYADQKDLDPTDLMAFIRLESRFNPHAVSNHGALGLMQVMARIHKDKLQGQSPFNMETSIRVGAQIYFDCLVKNNNSVRKATNCYSGGGGKEYYKKYKEFKKEGELFMITELFKSPIDFDNSTVMAIN